ncbi:MAG: hypothetical protein D8H93_26790 [Capnocytophaga sp.]|jgi:hypothetical protein|nr:MAG: hypothetical protein D8H93_26790 [Capnocytophaga sp.]
MAIINIETGEIFGQATKEERYILSKVAILIKKILSLKCNAEEKERIIQHIFYLIELIITFAKNI